MKDLSQITTVILAGGLGARLRSVVPDRPKVLAEVLKRPFLTYLLDQLASENGSHVVLCTGYSERVASEKTEQLGLAAFIMKPVTINDLACVVRKVLDSAGTENQSIVASSHLRVVSRN